MFFKCYIGYTAHCMNVSQKVWWGKLREGDHLGDPGVDGRIILDGSPGSGM
jgi:hypothetical protein